METYSTVRKKNTIGEKYCNGDYFKTFVIQLKLKICRKQCER